MSKLDKKTVFGKTGLALPPIIFGTSCLGNLYHALSYETKLEIGRQFFEHVKSPIVLDSAGKYGAGLALEVIGRTLRDLGKATDDVIISNKLGWTRVPLKGAEPTFEPGAWIGIEHDAELSINHSGIIDCWEQGCELLGDYQPQLLSVHDPDEYLAAVQNDKKERNRRLEDVIGAYSALHELKIKGYTKSIGIGAKDWKVIREICNLVELDWVMLACSLTVYTHSTELLEFIEELNAKNIPIINSAVFNAGFLIGGAYFNYRIPQKDKDSELFAWRESFMAVCDEFDVKPANACVQFGFSAPGIVSVALNTSRPERVRDNVESVMIKIPHEFWAALKAKGIIAKDYPYLGGKEPAND